MTSSIHIERFDVHYTIPRGVDIEPLQQRLDKVVSQMLPRLWDSRTPVNGVDEPIFFIDRLDLELLLPALAMDDTAIAGTFAERLGSVIASAIARGDQGVVQFATRADFIASFVQDLVRGSAWEHWYYQEFEPLRSASNPAIIRTLLCEDADVGRDALLELTGRGDLELLLAALSHDEATAIVTRCLLPASPRVHLPGRHGTWVEALRLLIRRTRFRRAGGPRDLAILYTGLLRERPDLGPDVHLARFISEVLALAGTLSRRPDSVRALRILRAEGTREFADMLGLGADGTMSDSGLNVQVREIMDLLRTLDREGEGMADLLRDLGADEGAAPAATLLTTRFGGAYLLAPALAELKLHALLAEQDIDLREQGTLVGLLLLQCLGAGNAGMAIKDRALHFLAGAGGGISGVDLDRIALPERMYRVLEGLRAAYPSVRERVGEYRLGKHDADSAEDYVFSGDDMALIVPEMLSEALWPLSSLVMRLFASRLGAFADSSPAYLRKNFLESAAHVEVTDETVAVCLMGTPLGMVLRMAGFERTAMELEWLGGRTLSFTFDMENGSVMGDGL